MLVGAGKPTLLASEVLLGKTDQGQKESKDSAVTPAEDTRRQEQTSSVTKTGGAGTQGAGGHMMAERRFWKPDNINHPHLPRITS